MQDETLSGDNDGGGGGEVVLEVFVERTGTLPAHSGGGSKSNKNERKSLRDFATSDGATRAMLTGGPGTPEQLGPSTWRVRAHGFGGRLFFVGPVTRLNPVSDFKLVTGDGGCEEEGVNSVTMRMEQTSGGIEGTPPGVVRWINRAYRAEKTVTTVTVDAAAGTVVASLDLRLVLAVPSAFRLVPKRKIEAAMRDALTVGTR